MSLVAAVLLSLASVRQAEAQIGGLIKKKAAEAVGKKDAKKDGGKEVAKDDGPMTSQFEKECGPVTPESVEQFLKGLQAERAAREQFDREAAATKPAAEVRACQDREQISPEARAILHRGVENGAPAGMDVAKQMEKNKAEFDKFVLKKCGVSDEKYGKSQRVRAYYEAEKTGAKEAGLSDECYAKYKEFVTAFCKLPPAQQQAAAEQGLKTPGQGKDVYWVFTASEAKAFLPKCRDLMAGIKATGYEEK